MVKATWLNNDTLCQAPTLCYKDLCRHDQTCGDSRKIGWLNEKLRTVAMQ